MGNDIESLVMESFLSSLTYVEREQIKQILIKYPFLNEISRENPIDVIYFLKNEIINRE